MSNIVCLYCLLNGKVVLFYFQIGEDIESQREIIKQEYITDYISSHRLRWLGHVARMEIDRLPKRVMEGSVESSRAVVRPRMRWYDNAMEDLCNMGLQNPREEWIEMAADRRVWRGLVRVVMGLQEA